MPELYWAVITSLVVVTQPSLTQALTTGRDQIIGAAIGGIVGGIGIVGIVHGMAPLAVFALALVPLAMMTAVRPSLRLSCVTLVIVVLIPASGPPFEKPIHRVLEILIGAGAAFVVSFLFPNRAIQIASQRAASMLDALDRLVSLSLERPDARAEADALNSECERAEQDIAESTAEAGREQIIVSIGHPRAEAASAVVKVAPLLRRLHRDTLFLGRVVAASGAAGTPVAAAAAPGGAGHAPIEVFPGFEQGFSAAAAAIGQILRGTGADQRTAAQSLEAARAAVDQLLAVVYPGSCGATDMSSGSVARTEARASAQPVAGSAARPDMALDFVIRLLAHDLEDFILTLSPKLP